MVHSSSGLGMGRLAVYVWLYWQSRCGYTVSVGVVTVAV